MEWLNLEGIGGKKAKFCKILIIALFFLEKAIFCRKLSKIAAHRNIITSTPGKNY
jgi:hypothetical protein